MHCASSSLLFDLALYLALDSLERCYETFWASTMALPAADWRFQGGSKL